MQKLAKFILFPLANLKSQITIPKTKGTMDNA
jgi:hypothetical protein